MSEAPFVPEAGHTEAEIVEEPPWVLLRSRPFLRLWSAQLTSSIGDWIGILAIVALAQNLGGVAAVSLVMTARMLPGFFLAPVAGALVDRLDRRKVMAGADIGRGLVLLMIPFTDSLGALIVASFVMEILTIMGGTAKDAAVPNFVKNDQLAMANSLGMVASYGMFPIGGIAFAALAGLAAFLGSIGALDFVNVSQISLALWFDAITFFVSAFLVLGLPIGRAVRDESEPTAASWRDTWNDMVEGMRYLKSHRLARAVIVGMGVGLIGGGAMVPLGPVFAEQVLGGGAATFSLLMVALGTGAAIGVVLLLFSQRHVSKAAVFPWAVIASGLAIVFAASMSNTALAMLGVALVGGFAGTAYISGFTMLQEDVVDELRGRTFAALYTVVRVCLLLSLTVAPLFAAVYAWAVTRFVADATVNLVGMEYELAGVRVALWAGGALTVLAGLYARRELRAREPVITVHA